MKLKVLNIFDPTEFTDQEKLFAWVTTKFLQRYGWMNEFMIHSKDLAVIYRGSTGGAIGIVHTFKRFQDYFDFAEYSEVTYSFSLKKKYRQHVERYGSISQTLEVEITDPKVLAIYLYLLGQLNPHTSWCTDGLRIESKDDQRQQVLTGWELTQLLTSGINLDI